MTVLTEGDLEITLPSDVVGRKFDDASHGLSHCMKAVDFIIELPDRILFVECKDPGNPNTRTEDRMAFIKEFLGGAMDRDLQTKYRDSWLYEWSCGRTEKPIHYCVLIGDSTLSKPALLIRTDKLKKQIPFSGPKDRGWKRSFIAGCLVMNLETWNQTFPDYPVRRIRS